MGILGYRGSHRHCRKVLFVRDRDVFLLSLFLPMAERRGLRALYAFRDFINLGVKGAGRPEDKRSFLKICENLLERIYSGQRRDFTEPFEEALEQAVVRFEIPRRLFQNAVEGGLAQSNFRRPYTQEDLLIEAYYGAGVWGVIASYLLGTRPEFQDLGNHVGAYLWLGARFRSLKEDRAQGRNYFPGQWSDSDSAAESALRRRWLEFYDEIGAQIETGLAGVSNRAAKNFIRVLLARHKLSREHRDEKDRD